MLPVLLKFGGLFFFILLLCYLIAEMTAFIGKRIAKKNPENPKHRPQPINNDIKGPYDAQTSAEYDDKSKENIINEDEK